MDDLFFFSLERKSDGFIEYRLARSFADLYVRFGSRYLSKYCNIHQLKSLTYVHIDAINSFLSKV